MMMFLNAVLAIMFGVFCLSLGAPDWAAYAVAMVLFYLDNLRDSVRERK
jgi:hypothetical protein